MPHDVSGFFEARGYRLERELGRGGMGVVYLAHQVSLSRDVALKVILTEGEATAHLRRFHREAATLQGIQHRNVVRLLDASLDTTPAFIVCEYVAGCRPLDEVLEDSGALPLPERLAIARGILEGLAALHDKDVAHRDLKPANILLDPNGEPRLIDFGLARTLSANETRHTGEGLIVGTVAYMAPELILGEDATLASDLYSWAQVASELICGRALFGAAGSVQASDRIAGWSPDLRAEVPGLDPRIERLVLSSLDRRPDQRPRSATAARARWPAEATAASQAATAAHPALAAKPVRRPTGPVKLPRAEPPPAPRRAWKVAALAGFAIILVTLTWLARDRAPHPKPSLRAPAAPSDLRVELQGTNLVLLARTSEPLSAQVSWRARDTAQSRSYPTTTAHSLIIGGTEMTDGDDLSARIGDQAIDLPSLADGVVTRLEQQLKRLPVRSVINQVAQLRGQGKPFLALQAALHAGIGSEIPAVINAVAPIARLWFLHTSDDRRIGYLRAVYALELLNSYAALHEFKEPASSQSLLPSAWRMAAVPRDSVDNPRSRLVPVTGPPTKIWSRLDGHALEKDEPMLGGAGWRYLAFWLNSGGGYRPDHVGDALLGAKRPADRFSSTSWSLEFDLPPECARAREVVAMVYAQEAGQGVLWGKFNDRTDVPFCHNVGGLKPSKGITVDFVRAIPSRLLKSGRNTVTFNLKPYPGLTRVDPIWIGWLCMILHSPEFK